MHDIFATEASVGDFQRFSAAPPLVDLNCRKRIRARVLAHLQFDLVKLLLILAASELSQCEWRHSWLAESWRVSLVGDLWTPLFGI